MYRLLYDTIWKSTGFLWKYLNVRSCSVYGSKMKTFFQTNMFDRHGSKRDFEHLGSGRRTYDNIHLESLDLAVMFFFQYDVYFIMNVRHCLDLRCESRWTGCRSCHVRSPTLNHLNFLSGACYVSFLHKVHLFLHKVPCAFLQRMSKSGTKNKEIDSTTLIFHALL